MTPILTGSDSFDGFERHDDPLPSFNESPRVDKNGKNGEDPLLERLYKYHSKYRVIVESPPPPGEPDEAAPVDPVSPP